MFLPLSPPPSSKPASDSPDTFFKCDSLSLLSPSKRALSPIQPSSLDDNISIGSQPTRVLPFLYLGSSRDANNLDYLKTQSVRFIVNCGHENHHLAGGPKPTNRKRVRDSTRENEENSENSAFGSRVVGNISKCDSVTDCYSSTARVLNIPAFDSPQQDLKQYFHQVISFIEQCRLSSASVLVHCTAGISRSATFVVAYIMWYMNLSFMAAYKYVQNLRPQISPNLNFVGQLVQFASDIDSESASPSSIISNRGSPLGPVLPALLCDHQVKVTRGRKRSNSENVAVDLSSKRQSHKVQQPDNLSET